MERETMRSITAWLLLASFHQEPVASHVTAAGSCVHVTRPGTTPRGTPTGESVGSKREERRVVAAAMDRANCRRVIPIFDSSRTKSSSALARESHACQDASYIGDAGDHARHRVVGMNLILQIDEALVFRGDERFKHLPHRHDTVSHR